MVIWAIPASRTPGRLVSLSIRTRNNSDLNDALVPWRRWDGMQLNACALAPMRRSQMPKHKDSVTTLSTQRQACGPAKTFAARPPDRLPPALILGFEGGAQWPLSVGIESRSRRRHFRARAS